MKSLRSSSGIVLTALLVLFLHLDLRAQMAAFTLQGRVLDASGEPIPFANIYIPEANFGSSSDFHGRYSLRGLKPGLYTVQATAMGYERREQVIDLSKEHVELLDLILTEKAYAIPQFEVTGSRNYSLRRLPGSASRIDKKEIEQLAPLSGNELFRRVPGVHVVDEEGAGLRTNIGIRGLDPARSRGVLMLEDGIPIALNPYGEPEMYFTPSVDRMAGVEVIKGAGQIAYGPRTIGGVVNYLTPEPPEEQEVGLRLQGGQGGYFSGLLSYGNTTGNTGVYLSFLRRQADDLAGAEFQLNDLNLKVQHKLSSKSTIGLKVGIYNESSNSTYLGLTQSMWDMGGMDFVRMAPEDLLRVNRYSFSAYHNVNFNERTELRTTFYAYTIDRNWRRQDFSNDGGRSDLTGVVWGDPSIIDGAVYMRNGNGHRNRSFNVAGLESKLRHKHETLGLRNELQVGTRLQYEDAHESRINGSYPSALSGDMVNQELRTGRAMSAFAENKIWLRENLVFSLGLRGELYDYEREIQRSSRRDTLVSAGNQVAALIPGAGLNYSVSNRTTLFAGVHRGFAPPRLKDAITAEGEVYELGAELSWSSELGVRSSPFSFLSLEATAFHMDFENQIISVSESVGGPGSGLVNGGRTLHRGLELGAILSIAQLADLPFSLDWDINATYVDAQFSADRFVVEGEEQINIRGNRTPYAPEYLLSSALSFESPSGIALRLTATYVGEQFTDPINSREPSPDGRDGLLSDYLILDATARYRLPGTSVAFTLSCKNITDERFIASRRPQGIRPGLPRFITAGVSLQF